MFLFSRFTTAVSNGRFLQLYRSLVADGSLRADPRQLAVVELFQALGDRIETKKKIPDQSSYFDNFVGGAKVPVRSSGLYLVGGCGTGKTMLMDLFYDNLEFRKKKRVHFHEYMIDVHARLFRLQKTRQTNALIDRVAEELMADAEVLCFDEFQVTFIADAVIMRRLFTTMLERGVVIVATSNRVPDDLYIGGLNRDLFVPFIPVLKAHCTVHNMDSETDYRQLAVVGEGQAYFGNAGNNLLESKFFRLARNESDPAEIQVQGRVVHIRRVAKHGKIAWFSFQELCDKPLGSADYISIAKKFHTVFVENIPKLTLNERDQLRRFISLIDSLYDAKCRLFFATQAESLESIFVPDGTSKYIDEVFAWDRTLSRLTEMVSEEYQVAHLRRLDYSDFFGQFEKPSDLFQRYKIHNESVIAQEGLNRMVDEIARYTGHKVAAPQRERMEFEEFKDWADSHLQK